MKSINSQQRWKIKGNWEMGQDEWRKSRQMQSSIFLQMRRPKTLVDRATSQGAAPSIYVVLVYCLQQMWLFGAGPYVALSAIFSRVGAHHHIPNKRSSGKNVNSS